MMQDADSNDPDDPLVEAVARVMCEAKGHSPDTLYEHHEWEEWPVDQRRDYVGLDGSQHVNLMHYAWRRYEKAARAIIPIIRDAERDAVVAFMQKEWPLSTTAPFIKSIAANAHRKERT
jgi:hypothetical protein